VSRRLPKLARLALCALLASSLSALAEPELPRELKSRLDAVEAELEAWDVEGARRALAEAVAVAVREEGALQYFRGRVAFEQGRYEEAVTLLSAAGIADQPGSYLRLSKDTQAIVQDHQRAESEHFVLLYPAGKDEVLVPYALEALEDIRAALLNDLGHAPAGKVRVEIVNNARELSKVSTLTTAQIKTTGTIAICKFNKLMVTSPKAVLRGYDWLDTLAHEYVHLVVSQKSRNTVPIWLHEGLAKFLESRWRGAPGLALSPSTLALLGDRVKKDKLIPFAKMHPSIALLPSAEDAATAFAEVFYAIDLIFREQGTSGLRRVLEGLRAGKSDQAAVELAMGRPFPAFEKSWLAHIKRQPFPKELLPLTEGVVLKEEGAQDPKRKEPKGKEVSFGAFVEVEEPQARRFAHLGELLRERGRTKAAAQEYAKAHQRVGDKYESVSNKYALALLELDRTEQAEAVLQGSLRVHPGVPATHVHLGRIHLARGQLDKAKRSYLDALAADPFDEEIHFSLLHIALRQHDEKLAARARAASQLLSGLSAEQVNEVAQRLSKAGPAAAEGRDAGTL
jgi:tetratricopeptide (TPR) repeat protein